MISWWGRFGRFFSGSFVAEPWPATSSPPPDEVVQLGIQAQRLLEDPVLRLALDRIQTKLVETWRQTQVGDHRGREAAYQMYWAAEQFKAELRQMIGSGRIGHRN